MTVTENNCVADERGRILAGPFPTNAAARRWVDRNIGEGLRAPGSVPPHWARVRRPERRGALALTWSEPMTKGTETENTDMDEPISEAVEIAETVHEAFMRAIAGNLRFQPARPSGGRAFMIGGAKAAAQKRDDGQA